MPKTVKMITLRGVTSIGYHTEFRLFALDAYWKREIGWSPQEDIFDEFLLRGNGSLSKH